MENAHAIFLERQSTRLDFYNKDFWETAKFFAGLLTVLVSAPFAIWAQAGRPNNWSLVAAASPVAAAILAVLARALLTRNATSYYETAASVVILEARLGMHFMSDSKGLTLPVTGKRRIEQGRSSIAELEAEFKQRLSGLIGTSRMSAMISIFTALFVVALAETITLLIHGFWGVNVVTYLKSMVTN